MKDEIRKISCCIAALTCLLLFAGCGKKEEEKPVPVASAPAEKELSPATPAEPAVREEVIGAEKVVEESPVAVRYTLTYTVFANGSLTGATAQTVARGGGGSPVTAVPDEGYHFVRWSDGSTVNPRTDLNVQADTAVTANFAINRYTLTYAAGAGGSIEGVRSQSSEHGGAGSEVTAVANKGYHFTGWSDGVTSANRTDTGITANLSATAGFAVNTWAVGGMVEGLVKGTEVVLQNSGGDNLTLRADGPFTFATVVPEGRPYEVRVLVQPTSPNQTCSVAGGSGTVPDGHVTDIRVECKLNTYTIGGMLAGLPDGSQLVLRNNKADDLVVNGNGPFAFAKALNDGSTYDVAIHSRKLPPKWFCQVETGKGKLAGSDVTGVDVGCFPEADLQAAAGMGKVDLKWNSGDFPGATFNLCRAQQEIPENGFGRCASLKGGRQEAKTGSPKAVAGLVNDVTYWFQVEVEHAGGRRTYSPVVNATPFGGLNDTGIDWCADNDSNRFPEGARSEKTAGCEAVASTHPGQDARHGRDAAARDRKLSKRGSGSAGFDFTKVCMNGDGAGKGKCPPNPSLGEGPTNWACTRDNVTGLIWEVKTDSGLRSQGNTYSWHNPDAAVNGGAPGTQNGGRCTGSGCDTHAYVQAVNKEGLCGASDWRLPSRRELLSIVDNGRYKPAIDAGYFPNTPAAYYWTSSPYSEQPASAWQVYFLYGEAYANSKHQGVGVRLVRTGE